MGSRMEFLRRRRTAVVGSALGVLALGAVLVPTSASSAPGPGTSFSGFVNPGWTTTDCLARSQPGSGSTQTTVRVGVTNSGIGIPKNAKKIRVSFAGNIYPSVVLSAANNWEHTYPAGQSVPCRRVRSVVTFQPLKANGSPTGRADTDTLGYALCASPCSAP